MENLRLVLAGLDLGFEHVVMARIYLTHQAHASEGKPLGYVATNVPAPLQRCSVVGIFRISSRASPPAGTKTDASESLSA
jgi:hypothetical protein